MKKEKKGFTLLELVIVIAVFAILIAILIPTFFGIIRRTRLSVDQTTVKNMNTFAIESEHAIGKAKTIREAIAVLAENGYNIEKLTPTADGALILWDSIADRWILFDTTSQTYIQFDKNTQIAPDVYLWNVSETYTPKYSVYLKKGYQGEKNIDIVTGLDVGENANIENVNYTRKTGASQSVIIYTISANTNVTINAPMDVVEHYGKAGSVDIIAVANASYHEYGEVKFVEIAKGRVALEKTATVEQIHISTKVNDVSAEGEKTKEENTFDEIIIALDEDVVVPTFSRDEISTIADEGTLVVELQNSTNKDEAESDFVWLFQNGLKEQIRISDNNETAGDTRATDDSVAQKTATLAEEIANNVKQGETLTEEDFNEDGSVKEEALAKIEETGLNENKKETQKTNLVNEAIEEELKEIPACTIGTITYETIEDAFDAVPDNEMTVIKINKDVFIFGNAGIEIATTKNITLDLNGYKVTGVFDEAKSARVFKNKGNFIITDTSADKSGIITDAGLTYDELGNWHTEPRRNYADNVIDNYGTLTLQNGSIINGSYGNIVYCVDNYQGGRFTVNGGHLYNSTTYTIRMFCNGTTLNNQVIINGGLIEGAGIWVQNPGAALNRGSLIITGGTFRQTGSIEMIYSYEAYYGTKADSYGTKYDCSNISISISGNPVFEGDIMIYGCSADHSKEPVVTIAGGTFNGSVDLCYSAQITGGTFKLGEGPFWYGWGTDSWFAGCGEGWQSADEWRAHGYTVIASTKYAGYYEIYTPDANRSDLADYLADGYTFVNAGNGNWNVVFEN